LRNAPPRSIIVLQACAHNPTGNGPTQEEWARIAKVIKVHGHFPFFDCAYQGFASGDLLRDSWAVRYFIEQGFELCIAQSFAKNLGMYGECVGAFHFICAPNPDAEAVSQLVSSQLALIQRAEISNPLAYGARIASCVLNDSALFAQWEEKLRIMSGRLSGMRREVQEQLEAQGTPGSWGFLTDRIGMFSYTGLSKEQINKIRDKWHIYMVSEAYHLHTNVVTQ
jgi:aspartate aminotransferase